MIKDLKLYNYIKYIDLQSFSIFTLWLFHIAAIIGITLGYFDFFITKTPLNLLIASCLLCVNYKINSQKKILFSLLFFTVGMLVEWIGVHYDFLFGAYTYGSNLGWKLDGVPIFIGINWAVLVLITGVISSRLVSISWLQPFFGAFLMVFLDFFMEHTAPIFDFWTFTGGLAPLQNYISWFLIALFLHSIFQYVKIKGNFKFSLHLYLCQLVFFGYFYFLL